MGAAFLKIWDWNLRRYLQPKALRAQRGSTAREAGHQHNLRRLNWECDLPARRRGYEPARIRSDFRTLRLKRSEAGRPMSATAATLVKNGVAPKRAVSTDLAPGCKSVATATGTSDQAAYPPTINATPTAKRQPRRVEELSCATTFLGSPFPMIACCATMGPQSVTFK